MQPFIPGLLRFMPKEKWMVFGILGGSLVYLAAFAAGKNIAALFICQILYGVFTSINANLIYAVSAGFADETLERNGVNASDIFATMLALASKIGMAVAGGLAPFFMELSGYSSNVSVLPNSALIGIKATFFGGTLFFLTASWIVMATFERTTRAR
jgi:Na+/melibiose symporter-like transporter